MTFVNGRHFISNSEVQTFKECRRKWWLNWYSGYRPKTAEVVGVRSSGTRLHAGLAELYTTGGTGQRALGALKALQDDDLRRSVDEKRKELLSSFVMEQAMLEGYLVWLADSGEDADLEPVASEAYLEAPLELPGTDDVILIGKIDARVRDRRTNRRKFIDHKSVTVFRSYTSLRRNEQMLHYLLLEFLTTQTADERCDAALYNQLRRSKHTSRAKPPFYMREEIPHNQHELASYRRRLVATILQMQELTRVSELNPGKLPDEAYPTPSDRCSWACDFDKICSMFDDGSRVGAALDDLFVKGDPLSYYGKHEQEEDT